jgi:hypothetical protein
MSVRIIGLLVALPLLMTSLAVVRMRVNRGGDRAPIVLTELEVTVGQRGSETAGRRIWLNWTTTPTQPARAASRRALRRRTYAAFELDPAITGQSRLVLVEHHDDPEVLAQRYPDGRTHLITAATVDEAGHVMRIDPSGLVVPREIASKLPVPRNERRLPHLQALLRHAALRPELGAVDR